MGPETAYKERLKQQQTQYEAGSDIHDLPPIFSYWSDKFLLPKMRAVCNASTVAEFYAHRFAELFVPGSGTVRLVSVGSGDSSVEIDITKALVAAGHCDMEFLCFDVAHNLIADANAKIRRAGLTSVMKSQFFDVNVDALPEPIDGIMAHHSLHHIVELERLFSMIDAALMPNGRFLSIDMIGRNGHVRWPETLGYIQALWEGLPDEKKYHHQLKQLHAEYLNFDCSEEGFEGIRSQDILPLLVSRFSFRMFMGLGGLVEIFTDRGYGHNYDVNSAWDTAFIDFVEELNERLLQIGLIKPTMLFADMAKKGRIVEPRYYKSRSPAFSIRRMW